jgi:hypothetical protein
VEEMSKYTKSASGQECQVRVPGVCNHNPETVVFAHLNGAGIGKKALDIHGAYACSDCHSWLDRQYAYDENIEAHSSMDRRYIRDLYHMDAVIRTQEIMFKEGILVL